MFLKISTCTRLSAIDHANTKFSEGYAATGIGVCVCTHHELLMKNGVGDLQKGKWYAFTVTSFSCRSHTYRYVNMDLIYLSVLQHYKDVDKLSTYDIMCQWLLNLLNHMLEYPKQYHIDLPAIDSLNYAIGKLHWYGHKQEDHSCYSLNWIPGVRYSDGEGIKHH